jgi:hypothetical protein
MSNAQTVEHHKNELGFFGRYLSVWVVLCIGAGIGLDSIAPGLAGFLDSLSIYSRGVHRKTQLDDIVERSLKQAALWDEVRDRLSRPALGISGGSNSVCASPAPSPSAPMFS